MLTIVRKGQEISFEPAFSCQAEAVNFIRHHRLEQKSDFVYSLLKQRADKRLSAKQEAWLFFIATEHKARLEKKAAPAADDDALALDGLTNVLRSAMGNGLKRPSLALQSDAGEITVKPGRQGVFWVTLNGELRGKIEASGKASLWKLGNAQEAVEKALMFATLQPLQALQQFGKITGRCSCCRRTLTDAKSIELGIGPICKAKFGL
jgi:hypothetical protein